MSVPADARPGPATVRVELKSKNGKQAAPAVLPVRIGKPAAK